MYSFFFNKNNKNKIINILKYSLQNKYFYNLFDIVDKEKEKKILFIYYFYKRN